jgi:hypothetical protein
MYIRSHANVENSVTIFLKYSEYSWRIMIVYYSNITFVSEEILQLFIS